MNFFKNFKFFLFVHALRPEMHSVMAVMAEFDSCFGFILDMMSFKFVDERMAELAIARLAGSHEAMNKRTNLCALE